MNDYELYESVLDAKTKDEGSFNAAARNWVEGSESVNFEDGEANDLFLEAKLHCRAWRNKAINGRISKQRMINCIRKIAEKDLPNPYPKKTEEVVITADVEPVHVFGVVEDEKETVEKEEISFFGKRRKK